MDNIGGAGYSALLFRARMVQYSTNERQAQGVATLDLIKIYFDFRNAFCVSIEFGSYAARNMFP